MEPQNLTQATNAATGPPPLYSETAVRGFSMFFSTVAGGFLMAQNLRDVGETGAARKALWGSIAYTALLVGVAMLLPDRFSGQSWVGVVTGLAGAAGLEAYFKRFVSNRNGFPKKSIGKPLFICLAVFIPVVALVLYSLQLQRP